MKNFRLFAAAAAALLMISVSNIDAQPKKNRGWQERMMSEKIAFITAELNLTPEEAQVFWPVYNQISEENKVSTKAMMTAYNTMLKAIEEGTASEKEIDKLLDEYLKAKEAHNDAGKKNADRYRKVLPSAKVVKLYVAEEKFRRNHIRSMKSNHHGKGQRPDQAKR